MRALSISFFVLVAAVATECLFIGGNRGPGNDGQGGPDNQGQGGPGQGGPGWGGPGQGGPGQGGPDNHGWGGPEQGGWGGPGNRHQGFLRRILGGFFRFRMMAQIMNTYCTGTVNATTESAIQACVSQINSTDTQNQIKALLNNINSPNNTMCVNGTLVRPTRGPRPFSGEGMAGSSGQSGESGDASGQSGVNPGGPNIPPPNAGAGPGPSGVNPGGPNMPGPQPFTPQDQQDMFAYTQCILAINHQDRRATTPTAATPV